MSANLAPTPLLPSNPLLELSYEPAFASLGDDYYDPVAAATFPRHDLRFRNDAVLQAIGLDPTEVSDAQFVEAFGQFAGFGHPFLAMRYHGYQFGSYNPMLGDGRGFLAGQVRGVDGELYDFGTKGSGKTPYSRGGDGRLTLKGGVREVLASETLHRMGVRTSRCLSLVETGEELWRGDEPSPTRSSVMVRFSRSHIRFGTFERLHYLKMTGKDTTPLVARLLNHAITTYYPHIELSPDPSMNGETAYVQFYNELVKKVAALAAQWMAAGFCHAVLNTDNMAITGESFDYGPFAFIPTYDPKFTAAYFDYSGRYSYGNQPGICKLNLEMLQTPLGMVIDRTAMKAAIVGYDTAFYAAYEREISRKLGFTDLDADDRRDLVRATVELFERFELDYPGFFAQLRREFSPAWRDDIAQIFPGIDPADALQEWRSIYHRILQTRSADELDTIRETLTINPFVVPLRPEIEAIWEPITEQDDWQPFYDLLDRIRA